MLESCDAVVIGAGHNGLVAANLLAQSGWDVIVVEAMDQPGGAVSTDELHPGFKTDRFSSFYPMTVVSPVMSEMDLESYGVRWSHAAKVLAHLRSDAPAPVVFMDPELTASELSHASVEDTAAWLVMSRQWNRIGGHVIDSLLSPFPPIRKLLHTAWVGRRDIVDLMKLPMQSVESFAAARFTGQDPALLLTGSALHADVSPAEAPSALIGWMLVSLAQTVGFPVPVGGASAIVEALLARLAVHGGQVRVGSAVESIRVSGSRAIGVDTYSGSIEARHGVIAACDAQILYSRLLAPRDVPASYLRRMAGFRRADATVKIDYALSTSVPWTDDRAVGAGTVHVAESPAEMWSTSAQISDGLLPSDPFLLVGQMSTADPSRSPQGTESMWVYSHVPQWVVGDTRGEIGSNGPLRSNALEQFAQRMEDRIEAHAPGFRQRILARRVTGPGDMEAADPSLIGGDINGGTAKLGQQLVLRPVRGFGRAETPIAGLYLGSASAHPGGAVHGACGANAAKAAMLHRRLRRRPS
ncbi:MAG: NAD(P)/FAD-dependent oxidoreductase [Microthrixaceae bacterium]|nr:NAD(P)/FAD-dependent oxidoreductase [Microthrixaceae bacterium]